jgi:hypothetical protein
MTPDIVAFEDVMNGLSGELLDLEPSQLDEIRAGCAAVKALCDKDLIELHLYEGLYPVVNYEDEISDSIKTIIGKKIYPLTTTVTVTTAANSTPEGTTTETVVLSGEENTTYTSDDDPEEIDPIFDEIDAEPVEVTPFAAEQNETMMILSPDLVALSLTAAANVGGLQDGLTTFSYNPLSSLIENTRSLLLYYTENNYANLNTALSVIYADSNLTSQYKQLRDATGGVDGLSGCVSQLDNFKDHTDRLSGLVLDETSPNAKTSDDSANEFLNLFDYSGGPTVIFKFNSRKFRSAKYMIQATALQTDRGHQATELYILHDNDKAYTREVTSIYTQDPFVTFTTRLLSGNVEILATTTAPNTDFVISGTRLRIARNSQSYQEMSQQKIIKQHEELSTYLDDGTDYVALQSASLFKGSVVANLGREFRDALAYLSSYAFTALSTGTKQTELVRIAETIKTRRQDIQNAIEADYDWFKNIRRQIEALNTGYALTVAYTDESGRSVPEQTLNSVTIDAISGT